MAVGTTITDILNQWDSYGVFSYVLPFLIIFAITFGILQKSKIFGEEEKVKGINAILALAVGLASLQFDFVSTFFAVIFPRFGVGLAVLLVVIIFLGLFWTDVKSAKDLKGWGIGLSIAIVIWAITSWDFWGDNFGLGYWLRDYFWTIIFLVVIIALISSVLKKPKDS